MFTESVLFILPICLISICKYYASLGNLSREGGGGILDCVVRTTQNYHFFDVAPFTIVHKQNTI